jgi:glycosyltransferase involved in cell wall biosynthesis
MLLGLPRTKVIRHDKNKGMVQAWNRCLVDASMEWICIIHDDDTVLSEGLATIRRACIVANGPAIILHENADRPSDGRFRCRIAQPGSWAVLNSSKVPSGTTVHRAVVDGAGLFDERFAYSSDIEYFARIAARFPSILIENPGVVNYRLHATNYQYSTWLQRDFVEQLEEAERRVVQYAGMSGDVGYQWWQSRMRTHALHMLRSAKRVADNELTLHVGTVLARRRYLGRRVRLAALTTAMLAWVVGGCRELWRAQVAAAQE